ncbi:MAG: tetratricopeptide repeat protein [Phycisphaerae bacterium]
MSPRKRRKPHPSRRSPEAKAESVRTSPDDNDSRPAGRSRLAEIGALVVAAGIAVGVLVLLPERQPPEQTTRAGPLDPAGGAVTLHNTAAITPDQWDVPDPDTTTMQDEVRERIQDARAEVLARPRSAEAWGSLGAVLDAHKIFDDAEICYRRASQLDPNLFLYSYLLAVVLDAQGHGAEELVALYRRANEQAPDYALVPWRLGDALVRQGNFAEAREAFLQSVEIDPDFAFGYRSLGQVMLALGDPEAAIVHFERAAELTPDDGGIYQGLARAYMAVGDRPRADEAAEKARSYEHRYRVPDPVIDEISALSVSSPVAYRRARNLIAQGDYANAIPDLLTVEKVRTDDPIVKIFLAEAFRRTGEYEEADLRLSAALNLKPDAVSAYMELGRLRLVQGKLDEAIESFRQAQELKPSQPTINVELGLALVRRGEYYDAISAFECASGEREVTPSVHVNWGFALRRTGAVREAIEHFREAVKLAPGYADAHAQLGLALAEAGYGEESMRELKRTAELDPNHPVAKRLSRGNP